MNLLSQSPTLFFSYAAIPFVCRVEWIDKNDSSAFSSSISKENEDISIFATWLHSFFFLFTRLLVFSILGIIITSLSHLMLFYQFRIFSSLSLLLTYCTLHLLDDIAVSRESQPKDPTKPQKAIVIIKMLCKHKMAFYVLFFHPGWSSRWGSHVILLLLYIYYCSSTFISGSTWWQNCILIRLDIGNKNSHE